MIPLIRGFRDILPEDIKLWQHVEKTAIHLLESFGFKEIRLPVMERSELFARSIGESTDIVEKEMYTFADRKGDLITLRPEATASVVRSYIQHNMYAQDAIRKFYTIGPMFRRERPQKGRYRQFYQINAEVFGIASPLIDVQMILILTTLFSRLRIADVHVHLNSLGCPDCRPVFTEQLLDLLGRVSGDLCTDCKRRQQKNPLRVLDCKVPSCRDAMKDAPAIIDFLCPACNKHFKSVQNALNGMNIEYVVDKRLVRGLDYYTRTTFEIQTGSLGAQSAVAGGGRYDGLVKTLGGPDQPATGFAIGFDRLVEIARQNQYSFSTAPDVFIAALGENSIGRAFEWACGLSVAGIKAEMDFSDKSLKSQMKRADKLGAVYVLIVGEKELAEGAAMLRSMSTQQQFSVPIEHMVDNITSIMNQNSL
jgi:histidyl-tRNA synthetase